MTNNKTTMFTTRENRMPAGIFLLLARLWRSIRFTRMRYTPAPRDTMDLPERPLRT